MHNFIKSEVWQKVKLTWDSYSLYRLHVYINKISSRIVNLVQIIVSVTTSIQEVNLYKLSPLNTHFKNVIFQIVLIMSHSSLWIGIWRRAQWKWRKAWPWKSNITKYRYIWRNVWLWETTRSRCIQVKWTRFLLNCYDIYVLQFILDVARCFCITLLNTYFDIHLISFLLINDWKNTKC